jgi:CubicO group peptidase (beta-lactamase class C family)
MLELADAGERQIPRERDFGGAPRPTLANWLTAPTNRWAFRHVRELILTERVSAGPGGPLPVVEDSDLLTEEVVRFLEESYTDAFVVLRDGQLAAEWYAPGVAVDDRHIMFSVSKSVVGIVASVLIADGLLEDSALVTKYVPEAAFGGYATATVRDLLNMTASIDFNEDYEGVDARRYREAIGMLPGAGEGEGIHKFIVSLPQSGPHGKALNYISPTAELASWVCERATGASLAQLISRYVWQPIGAEHCADLLIDRYGASRGSGGFCATARDMARLGQLLIDPPAGSLGLAIADLKKSAERDQWTAGNLNEFLPNGLYRSFWYQLDDAPGVYIAMGIHGQRVYVDSKCRTVIVQQSSLPESFDEPTWRQMIPRFQGIIAAN